MRARCARIFPDLPPNRVRAIAPRVRAICERHGVRYNTASFAKTVWSALTTVAALSVP